MRLHFKHVFGPQIDKWGILGFTPAQPAATALKNYALGEFILLAIPENPDPEFDCPEELHGRIFGRCTLLRWDAPAIRYANPRMAEERPAVIERWPTCAPVHQFWRLEEPVRYDQFAGLAQRAQSRGRLVALDIPSVSLWHDQIAWHEEEVFHNEHVARALGTSPRQ
jgi:hypothetical protein